MKNNLINSCVTKTVRWLMICIWVFSIHTYSNDIKAQNLDQIYLSLDVNQVTLSQIIEQIQKQTVFTFFFQDELLAEAGPKISLNAKNMPLREILNRISSEFQLNYKQTDYTIALKKQVDPVLVPGPPAVVSQQSAITGTVSDETGP